MQKQRFIKIALSIIVVYIVFSILFLGRSIIVPFIIAVLFSSAILALAGFYKKYRIPHALSLVLSLLTYVVIIYAVGIVITDNVDDILKELPEYEAQIKLLAYDTLVKIGVNPERTIGDFFGSINLQSTLNYLVGAFSSLVRNAGIILLYTFFILLESRNFKKKLDIVSGSRYSRNHIYEVIEHSKQDIKGYFIVKMYVSLMVGVVSYLIMLAFGLNFAAFWGLLIFLLNFIPYVGSIIAVVFPSLLSLVQPEFGLYSALFMISLLVLAQNLVGSVIEPKLMGNKLNLSPLVILLSLAFWGALWGVLGMLLCVPIMVIINIILSKIPATRPIAIMLSEKGNLKVKSTFGGFEEGFVKKILKK